MALGHDFLKNVSKFVGATIIAQIIGIITVPVFSRIFSPQVVGSFALFNSLVGILSVFGTGNYESAVMLPHQKVDAFNLVFISIGITFLWTIIILIIIFIFGSTLKNIGEFREIDNFFFLVPIFLFLTCVNRTFVIWCNRNKEFGFNAKISILSSLLSKMGNILFGFFGFITSTSLIVVNLFVLFLESAIRIKIFFLKERKNIDNVLSISKIQQNIIRYRKFALIGIWGRLIDTGSVLIVPIILSFFFSAAEVGLYSQSLTLVQLPVVLIASAMGQVLFQRLSETTLDGLSEVIISSFALLLQISIPIFGIIFFWGRELFSFVLGEQWSTSGVYAEMLAPWCCLKMCFSPLSSIFNILERQSVSLFLTIVIFTTRVLSILVGGFNGNIQLAILLFGISGFISNLIGIIIIFYLSKSKLQDILKGLTRNQFYK